MKPLPGSYRRRAGGEYDIYVIVRHVLSAAAEVERRMKSRGPPAGRTAVKLALELLTIDQLANQTSLV